MNLNSLTGVTSVEWMEDSSDESNTRRPLSWYKVHTHTKPLNLINIGHINIFGELFCLLKVLLKYQF